MLAFTPLLAFAAVVAAQAASGDPSIITPTGATQCLPAQISYTATNQPVTIDILPGGQAGAATIGTLGTQNASPFTWTVNQAGGTNCTLRIRDSLGALAYSGAFVVAQGSDSSCLGAGASTGSAASTGAPTSSASASSVASVSSVGSSSSAAVSSSIAESTSSVIASISSAVSTAMSPATSTRASASSASTSRSAVATSASASASSTPNSAASNMKVGFAGLVGLVAAVVIA